VLRHYRAVSVIRKNQRRLILHNRRWKEEMFGRRADDAAVVTSNETALAGFDQRFGPVL